MVKKTENEFTHDALVRAGRRFLVIKGGFTGYADKQLPCQVVITEMAGSHSEIPDVLGWYWGVTTLLEAKTSYADFQADAKKRFRSDPEQGMGVFRAYITPAGLIPESALPDGWGLIEVLSLRRTVVRVAPRAFTTRNKDAEFGVLFSMVRRLNFDRHESVSVASFRIPTKNKASAVIRGEEYTESDRFFDPVHKLLQYGKT